MVTMAARDKELVFVAGHRGLAGSAIARAIEADGTRDWTGRTRSELDLLDRDAVFAAMTELKPDALVIAAAKVGGIVANRDFPVDFLSQNLMLQTNLIDAAHAADVERVVFLGSSCIYPKFASQPIHEDSLLTGPLEPTNDAYAIAKIAGIRLVDAYRQQFGRHWVSAMPTNLYGPGDNFDLASSHVLPALIRRFDAAKREGAPEVVLWGTGDPLREFLHVDDLAAAVLFVMDSFDEPGPINIGYGEDLAIRELAHLVAEVVGYQGRIAWDTSKPDGTPRKILDSSRIRDLGWSPTIDLRAGITSTYAWYLEQQAAPAAS
jgi:GDP-L-fucose synthase